MNVYYYTPDDIGLAQFPQGELRVANAIDVSPENADVFILPCLIRCLSKEKLLNLKYLKGDENKHVFWNCAEDVKLWYELPSLFIRCDATKEIRSYDKNTIAWPWPVEDLYRPHEPFEYDVCFQGWESTPLTGTVVESVRRSGLKAHLQVHNYFFGYHYSDPNYKHLIESYRDTLSKSRLSLVPRSIPEGVIRYRFWESLSMGRVPVMFADGAVLPWKDKIDYGKCCILIPEKHATNSGEIIKEWLRTHSDSEIAEMGKYGREMWETWLAPKRWNELFGIATDEFLHIKR